MNPVPDPPRIEPSLEICLDVWGMGWRASGLLVLCDRKPKHTGKHLCRSPYGRIEWWGKGFTAQVNVTAEVRS